MDTFEARSKMRDLAQATLDLIEGLDRSSTSRREAIAGLRDMEQEARALLADAGYPGEAAWRGIQRSRILAESDPSVMDESMRGDIVGDLQLAVGTLGSLVSGALQRDSDFRIVG
jgi:hypothetical protein